jgi:hypothetical protein
MSLVENDEIEGRAELAGGIEMLVLEGTARTGSHGEGRFDENHPYCDIETFIRYREGRLIRITLEVIK